MNKLIPAIYDLLGEKVSVVENAIELNAGIHKFRIENANLNSKVYYINLKTKTGQGSIRMVK